MRYAKPITLLILCTAFFGCAGTEHTQVRTAPKGNQAMPGKDTAYGLGNAPQLFPNMGPYSRPITTSSAKAQRYFDQGLKWVYGFNHDEAVRSFTKAAELDPSCAMAWWGVAYAQGPNYNASRMNTARREAAWQATEKALAALDNETPVEQKLIRALTKRYRDPAVVAEGKLEDKKQEGKRLGELDKQAKAKFAEAMAKAWAAHPNDPDVGTLYADAMMVKNPWRLFKTDETPARDETLTIIKTLESVFAFAPRHPGANHLYIHAVESSSDRARAIPAADRLSDAVPASGHLTHMPSHLYVQVGMWVRAVEQNVLAMEADQQYLKRSPLQFRQHGYIAHNAHMLAFAAMMSGQEKHAMHGARAVWKLTADVFDTIGVRYDRAHCSVYEVMRRFGRWDEILAEPAPPEKLKKTNAVWRACRAVAFAAKKDFDNARAEHALFKELLAKQKNDKFMLLNDHFIAAEIALQQEQWDQAIAELIKATKYEDEIRYSEPPIWVQPVRHTLGAVYLKAGRFADAERVYKEDLERWPGNGWSLFGLTQALENQNKTKQAAVARKDFERAWSKADNPLGTSCKCIPKL